MNADLERQRIKALFDDLEHLAADPGAKDPDMEKELESLRTRLTELEKQVFSGNASHSQLPGQTALYDKEQIGYIFSGNKVEALKNVDGNLPRVENVLTSPLTVGDETIGAMQIGISEQRTWTADEQSLAQAIAQQVSLQIQNLRLLSATERARVEALAATRQYTHESWQAFMDAIHESEHIGFVYDQSAVEPYALPAPSDVDFQETVPVMDEQVGSLFLKANPDHPLQEEDKALVAAIARQVGQQVENIRLLADAARARAEAEEATLRLTRDSWKAYVERTEETLGFVYDSNRVAPLAGQTDNITLSQPLTVRGEPIGVLAVADRQGLSKEEADLLTAIARQTSIHLETLRLNEELQRRAQELQELDRLKSSFLANMSHELRTPLNSILGFSDVMLEGIDGALTEYMENDLRLIQKNGKHLLHLINDVLDMAKIESGRMNLHPEKFKINDVLDEVLSITSSLANEKKLALSIEAESDNIELFADITRIKQVMINIVNNSIKFTESGYVKICCKKLDPDKVRISIKDSGIGIPANHLETIFQEFAQVDSSTTRKVGGTGLGLPISRRLVEMHGGRLWAESAGIEGQGSTFIVELPLEAVITETVEKVTK